MTKIQVRYCRKGKRKEKKKILADLTSSRLQLYDLYSAVSFLGVDMAYVVDFVRSGV